MVLLNVLVHSSYPTSRIWAAAHSPMMYFTAVFLPVHVPRWTLHRQRWIAGLLFYLFIYYKRNSRKNYTYFFLIRRFFGLIHHVYARIVLQHSGFLWEMVGNSVERQGKETLYLSDLLLKVKPLLWFLCMELILPPKKDLAPCVEKNAVTVF